MSFISIPKGWNIIFSLLMGYGNKSCLTNTLWKTGDSHLLWFNLKHPIPLFNVFLHMGGDLKLNQDLVSPLISFLQTQLTRRWSMFSVSCLSAATLAGKGIF
ncbi:hypothetical protein ACJX0J_028277 [Zea mays]